jgi:hypothetical protein
MEILNVEQGSQEWLEARQGCITGTKLKEIMGTPYPARAPTEKAVDKIMMTAVWGLLWEEFAEVPEIYVNSAMQRGTDLEPIAIAKYEELTGQKVDTIWFVKINEWHWLSPDGLIAHDRKNTEHFNKWVEVKCPGGKNFVKCVIENSLPEEYVWQIVNYFLVVPTMEELDFIMFNPDFYITEKQMHVINIKREDMQELITRAEERLKLFRPLREEKILQLTKTPDVR